MTFLPNHPINLPHFFFTFLRNKLHTIARYCDEHSQRAHRLVSTDVKQKNHTPEENSNKKFIRLTKRMSEMDLCSRREADRLISLQSVSFSPKILVKGLPIRPIVGQKVSAQETDIVLHYTETTIDHIDKQNDHSNICWERIQYDTVVLHKPLGYVSGQPEVGYQPAVQLLTPKNYSDSNVHVLSNLNFQSRKHNHVLNRTLNGYVPAGRLDMNSTGLLIFTKNGVVAKKLVSNSSSLEKEYIVRVMGIQNNTLPNLTPLLQGGFTLRNDTQPLRPLKHAEWIKTDSKTATMRLVLNEGRKRQIRRMCEEMLGLRVISLERVRIGKLVLDDLPLGKWRLLKKSEIMDILKSEIGL